MYTGPWLPVHIEKLRYLSKCYIKLSVPEVKDGAWIIDELKSLINLRIVIKLVKSGYETTYMDTIIDAETRDMANNFCTSHCILSNVERPKFTNRPISYWMPLHPFKSKLEELTDYILMTWDEDDIEVRIFMQIIDDLNMICSINAEKDVFTTTEPILIQFEVLDLEKSPKITFAIHATD